MGQKAMGKRANVLCLLHEQAKPHAIPSVAEGFRARSSLPSVSEDLVAGILTME